jgi:hypothetical protein
LLILALTWATWREAPSLTAALAATRFEQWIAVVLLALHPLFLFLARHYRRTERPVALSPDDEPDANGGENGGENLAPGPPVD